MFLFEVRYSYVENPIQHSPFDWTVNLLADDCYGVEQRHEYRKKSPFKLKDPYLHLIEEALKLVQKDLAEVRKELRRQKVKVLKAKQDEAFTTYTFYYNGYEEHHSYFNPRIETK